MNHTHDFFNQTSREGIECTSSKRVAKVLLSHLHAVATAQPTTQTYKITRGDVVANSMDLACRHMQNGFLSYTLNTRDLTSYYYYVLKVLLCSASVPVVTSKLLFFPRQNPISLWKKSIALAPLPRVTGF